MQANGCVPPAPELRVRTPRSHHRFPREVERKRADDLLRMFEWSDDRICFGFPGVDRCQIERHSDTVKDRRTAKSIHTPKATANSILDHREMPLREIRPVDSSFPSLDSLLYTLAVQLQVFYVIILAR